MTKEQEEILRKEQQRVWDWMAANEREKLRRRGLSIIEADLSNSDKSTLVIDLSVNK